MIALFRLFTARGAPNLSTLATAIIGFLVGTALSLFYLPMFHVWGKGKR